MYVTANSADAKLSYCCRMQCILVVFVADKHRMWLIWQWNLKISKRILIRLNHVPLKMMYVLLSVFVLGIFLVDMSLL